MDAVGGSDWRCSVVADRTRLGLAEQFIEFFGELNGLMPSEPDE